MNEFFKNEVLARFLNNRLVKFLKNINKIPISWLLFVTIIILNSFRISAQEIILLPKEKQDEIDRYKELITRYKQANNSQQAAFYLNKVAFIYWEGGVFKEAIINFNESALHSEKINDYINVKSIYSNIALIYSDQERFDLALEYFYKSLDARRKLNDKPEIAAGLIDVAYIHTVLGQTEKAIPLLEESLALSRSVNNSRLILNCLKLLAANYDKMGNLAKYNEYKDLALVYEQQLEKQNLTSELEKEVTKSEEKLIKEQRERELQSKIYELQQLIAKAKQDSLGIVVTAKEDSLSRAQALADQQQKEIRLQRTAIELNQAKIREQEALARTRNIIIYAVSGILVLIIILGLFIYKNYKDKKKANELLSLQNVEIQNQRDHIQRQNENISKSINYAQGIQKALLPPQSSLQSVFSESFIFFRPRDIVSGDYYWFKVLENGASSSINNKFAIAAIDCTGHGVPGAFLSMIGYNLLDEIFNRGIYNPGSILKELNNGIRKALRQDETDNRDGMDMALCVVDPLAHTVEFAGAKNPVVYVCDNEVYRIRGDKESIGGGYGYIENDFTTHTINIEKPTWFYLFSDGFIDQFGGSDGRKFMIKGFVDLLASISVLPANQQREMLKNTLKDWIGTQYQQVDDILVLGFLVS